MNVFTALLCTLIGIYQIGGLTANNIDANKLADAIANDVKEKVGSDAAAANNIDTKEIQRIIAEVERDGMTINKEHADKISRAIADAIEKKDNKEDLSAAKKDDPTEVERHINDEQQDGAVKNRSAEIPNQEMMQQYMADRLKLEIDQAELEEAMGSDGKSNKEGEAESDEDENEDLDEEHKLVRRGWWGRRRRRWFRRVRCGWSCGWTYSNGRHRWRCSYRCTFQKLQTGTGNGNWELEP